MSDDRTGKPGWSQDESMETVSSTESAGQEGSCANPAQAGMQASASVENLRSRQYAYFQARLSAIEERMGINISTGAQTWAEAMEMIGVAPSTSRNAQGSSQAPVVDTLAPVRADRQKTGKGEEAAPSSTSENEAMARDPLISRYTFSEFIRRARARASRSVGQVPRAEGPVPGTQEAHFDRGDTPVTMESLRADRDQLARRLADLIAVLPAAIAVKIKRIQQLEECAAQLQRNYDRLAKEGEELRKREKEWEATFEENAALRALLRNMKCGAQAESESQDQ